ncbi:bifunctional demethylmenaquinone methyltransferase/2-methoxy-6-polyprenyl-1,4-benzoquinol methylase UbiE [Thermaurantimonas aggregans]|uniref:bifunctional demethylmenaquinone methyltransferase/2-methoxy-6-polyprenyl-1,4-benzoquinol methylase UbiE n=1 Tax=Thermaurantimonas aggregans TaxID=2173829 RepID=UPI0023F1FBF4|nr:bifunctional demethylmenaquinone methyltransferase/2-methoxy-6-polyprenyl-1,4-benzoquinol methylase UbiE [Thermaurantimonas aggregans]MCX8149667.1 bifunctional demethylmenaquinone methyltransferase/2-methoxy-6-polyprenyl-1,4-benzoquinol methylase UbiE [Thermaurantimonas aggregans]
MEVKPYSDKAGSKKEQVAEMFDNISPKYDFLNHTLSLGIDRGWRKKLLSLASKAKPKIILDVATGTGDLAIALAELNPEHIIGVDISEGMLSYGHKKIEKKGLKGLITLQKGDSEALEFADNTFDAVTVAFGVRNFEHLEAGLAEMLRVTKPGGKIYILEFSQPEGFPFAQLYKFYFKNILPLVGRWVSKDSRAYSYLPDSVEAFPFGEAFANILKKLGYKNIRLHRLTFGVATIYEAEK